MSRLGEARSNSMKLRWRCEISVRPARSSCDRPRCRRHQRRLAAKSCCRDMNTFQVVAETMPFGKMPQANAEHITRNTLGAGGGRVDWGCDRVGVELPRRVGGGDHALSRCWGRSDHACDPALGHRLCLRLSDGVASEGAMAGPEGP